MHKIRRRKTKMEEATVASEPRNKVKLMKMSKGYQWEITVAGENLTECIATAHDGDAQLKGMYPSE